LLDKLAHSMGGESVQSFMSEAVATVRADTTIAEATREMLRQRVHHLPVVDAKNHLIGIISTMDVLEQFAKSAPA
jgi:CBS-domain-containing membrane protein